MITLLRTPVPSFLLVFPPLNIKYLKCDGPDGKWEEYSKIAFSWPASFYALQQFVDIATNHQSKEIGHRLESRTSAIRAVRFALPESNYSFVLVDTPGFDDTYKSDMEILSMIADWLEKTYVELLG